MIMRGGMDGMKEENREDQQTNIHFLYRTHQN